MYSLSFLKIHWAPYCCVEGRPSTIGSLPRATSWRTHTPFHPATQLSIISQLGAGCHEPLPQTCWDIGWLHHVYTGLVHDVTASEFMRTMVLWCPADNVSLQMSTTCGSYFPLPLPEFSLSLWGWGSGIDAPLRSCFRPGCSIASYWPVVASVLISVYHTKKLLW